MGVGRDGRARQRDTGLSRAACDGCWRTHDGQEAPNWCCPDNTRGGGNANLSLYKRYIHVYRSRWYAVICCHENGSVDILQPSSSHICNLRYWNCWWEKYGMSRRTCMLQSDICMMNTCPLKHKSYFQLYVILGVIQFLRIICLNSYANIYIVFI